MPRQPVQATRGKHSDSSAASAVVHRQRDSEAPHPILGLQRRLGNRAVATLVRAARLQRMGTCGACALRRPEDDDRLRRHARRHDAKTPEATTREVEVGPVDDPYEREAERVATALVAHSPSVVRPPPPGATSASAASVRRKHCDCGGGAGCNCGGRDPPARTPTDLTRGGSPLEASVRHFFEDGLGHDLRTVRVHSGPDAEARTAALDAHAFTYRNHVWLGAGQAPQTSFVMAHELTHVVQQGAAAPLGARSTAAEDAPPISAGLDRAAALRRVGLAWEGPPPPGVPRPAPPVVTTVPGVCGPNVTTELGSTVSRLRTTFSGLSSTQKTECCDTLDSIFAGGYTWDVIELHNNAWIHLRYRPACATAGARPPCGSSVQVGSECYYAGSPNYVIFGTMCKLCRDHGLSRFSESAMLGLIDLYKGGWLFGLIGRSANYWESRRWGSAGYHGWPGGGTAPAGDRSNCAPTCSVPFSGPSFRVRWCPHLDPDSTCGSRSRHVRVGRRRRPGRSLPF